MSRLHPNPDPSQPGRHGPEGLAERDLQAQSGAIPWRRSDAGTLEILLISSKRGYWLVPKGGIDPGRSARDMASIESFEEAGVHGRVSELPIGDFTYEKSGGARCSVLLYGLEVLTVLDRWPEQAIRSRVWMDPAEAADLVRWPGMGALIRKLVASLGSPAGGSPSPAQDALHRGQLTSAQTTRPRA